MIDLAITSALKCAGRTLQVRPITGTGGDIEFHVTLLSSDGRMLQRTPLSGTSKEVFDLEATGATVDDALAALAWLMRRSIYGEAPLL